jgi:hypothetical protein
LFILILFVDNNYSLSPKPLVEISLIKLLQQLEAALEQLASLVTIVHHELEARVSQKGRHEPSDAQVKRIVTRVM